MAGGALWTVHGAFEMLQPLGAVTEYREQLGYSVVIDPVGYRLAGLAGPPAAVVTALALIGSVRPLPRTRPRTVTTWLAGTALVLGVVAAAGVVLAVDPPFEAGTTLARLLCSVAAVVAGIAVRRTSDGDRAGGWLTVAGAVGGLVLAARVLVNAFVMIPGAAAFAVSVAFGLSLAVAGNELARLGRPSPSTGGTTAPGTGSTATPGTSGG